MGMRGLGAVPKPKIGVGRPPTEPTIYDGLNVAAKVRRFIETRRVTKGILAGQHYEVHPFQVPILDAWYATDDEGKRVVRTGLLSVGRKNGKSGLASTIALCHLAGPLAEPRGEILVAATDRDQSSLIYDEVVALIEDDPQLTDRCNIKRHEKTITDVVTGSKFTALSSDAKKAHGPSPSLVILDELAQWGDTKAGRALYDALTTAQGGRKEPLVIIIGTQAPSADALMSKLVDYAKAINAGEIQDDRFRGFVYEVPEDLDVFDEASWPLANPALGSFRSIEDMRELAERAKRLPTLENTFRNLFCNQRVDPDVPLIPKKEWLACRADAPIRPGEEIYLALDLSATQDLTALVAVSAHDGERIKAWFWKPKDLLSEHVARDRAPYDVWVKEGWIEAPRGRAIDYGFVAKRVAEIRRQYKVLGLAYDRWHINNFLRELTNLGVDSFVHDGKSRVISGGLPLVPWGQGFADMAPAVDAFEISVLEGRLKHDGNPVMAMCVANAKPEMDAAGNRKLDKSATRFRIDGAVAAVMAIGLKSKQPKKEKSYQAFFLGGNPVLTR